MKRRHLLCSVGAAGLAGCPALLRAQPAARVRRVGLLYPYDAAMAQASPWAALVYAELARLGYEVGRNLQLDPLYADGDVDRLPGLAAELVRREPDLILAIGNDAAAAARAATRTLPIVMGFTAEPVGSGLVDTLARPGANLTGTTWLSAEIAGKGLELLRQAVPSLTRLAALGNPATPGMRFYREAYASAAARLGIDTLPVVVHRPEELEAALVAIAASRAQALYVTAEPATEVRVAAIAEFALQHKLPTMGMGPRLVEAGGLLYYGADVNEAIVRTVGFIDRILRGARPAELPIEQPARLEFTVNQRTAHALGLTLPANLLLRATRVIE